MRTQDTEELIKELNAKQELLLDTLEKYRDVAVVEWIPHEIDGVPVSRLGEERIFLAENILTQFGRSRGEHGG